uniref:Myeloid zinc finger 1 n=1 Tax=Molossus molossus TaxID=27622 RepID=A0A7J8C9L8_MOLMO|nr:myeloid zinc finger 1 [Molossus molossus]
MRPAALGSPKHTEGKRPVMVKLEDSEEVEEATPWDPGPEAACRCFRHFCYEEAAGAREALTLLRKLCYQWLQPEVHSKEQMLELLVLEQFLGALPPEIQAPVRRQRPGSPEEAVALVEGLLQDPGEPRRWCWTTEPEPETTSGATQRSALSLQVKEEPAVSEDPDFLDSGPLVSPQETTSTLLPEEAQGCRVLLDQASPHSKTGPEGPSWREHPGALWQEEGGDIFSPVYPRCLPRTHPRAKPAYFSMASKDQWE